MRTICTCQHQNCPGCVPAPRRSLCLLAAKFIAGAALLLGACAAVWSVGT